MKQRILDILGAISSFIEYCVTRKCWMCNGTGETELDGIPVTCSECKGNKRL